MSENNEKYLIYTYSQKSDGNYKQNEKKISEIKIKANTKTEAEGLYIFAKKEMRNKDD